MTRWGRYALLAVVLVAVLSIGVEAAVSSADLDPEHCASAQLSVYEDEVDAVDTEAYATLSSREQAVIDRARHRDNRTAVVDAELFAGLPRGVVIEGTTYRISGYYTDCAMVAGTPQWLNPVLVLFLTIYEIFSGLYLPGAVVITAVLGYRRVDDWLQFE